MNIKEIPSSNYIKFIKSKIEKADVLLDIGCGIRPQLFAKSKIHICCEPFEEYNEILNYNIRTRLNNNKKKYIAIKANWQKVVELFPERSVDTVLIFDVIEHLDKEEGRILLEKTIKIPCKQLVIYTPLGFVPQLHIDGKDAWGLSGAAVQEHKSGWTPEDFGDDWDFYIGKDFITRDNIGNLFPKPYSALLAIKNFSKDEIIYSQDIINKSAETFNWVKPQSYLNSVVESIKRRLLNKNVQSQSIHNHPCL